MSRRRVRWIPVGVFTKMQRIDTNIGRRVVRGAVTVGQNFDVVPVRQLRRQIRRYMGDGLGRVESFTDRFADTTDLLLLAYAPLATKLDPTRPLARATAKSASFRIPCASTR